MYLKKYTENITIIDNMIYVGTGRGWLQMEGTVKNVVVENNTIIGEIESSPGETGEPFIFLKIASIVIAIAVVVLSV